MLDWRLDSWVHVKRSEYRSGMFSLFSRFRIYEWDFSFFLLSFCVQLSIYDWDLVQKKGSVIFNIVSSNRFCWFCFLHFLLAIAYRTVATASFLAWSQTPRLLASEHTIMFCIFMFWWTRGCHLDALAQKKFIFLLHFRYFSATKPGLRLFWGHFLILVVTLVFWYFSSFF